MKSFRRGRVTGRPRSRFSGRGRNRRGRGRRGSSRGYFVSRGGIRL